MGFENRTTASIILQLKAEEESRGCMTSSGIYTLLLAAFERIEALEREVANLPFRIEDATGVRP